MNRVLKFSIWSLGLVLLVGLYFFDNIRGYYRFKEICAKEAGLRVYEALQKGEGWQTSGKSDASYLLHFYDRVSFVRYFDDEKSLKDLIRTTDKKDFSDDGYRPQTVDNNRQPQYQYLHIFQAVNGEVRMNSHISTITNIQSGKTAATYKDFTYRLFNPDWGSSGGSACSGLNRDDLDKAPNDSKERAIQSAFTK